MFAFNSFKCATCLPREYKTHLLAQCAENIIISAYLHSRNSQTVAILYQNQEVLTLPFLKLAIFPFAFNRHFVMNSLYICYRSFSHAILHGIYACTCMYGSENAHRVFTVLIAKRVLTCRYPAKHINIFLSLIFLSRTAGIYHSENYFQNFGINTA